MVLLGKLVLPVIQEQLEMLVQQELPVRKVHKVLKVILVLLERLVLLVQPVLMVLLDQTVLTVGIKMVMVQMTRAKIETVMVFLTP